MFFRRLSNEDAALIMLEFLTDRGYEECKRPHSVPPGMYRIRVLHNSKGASKFLFSIKPKVGETFFTGSGDAFPASKNKRLKYRKKLIPV